ncbi:hypothetical protein [Glutamicibacter arilaitensis]|uniref:hypothetical protein n=1 Tax=Glutamicibacter arilaitensis TaxID=256701 RepID=UPI003F90AA3B
MTYEELIKEHLTGPLVKVNDIKKGDLVARVRPGHTTIIEVDKNLPTVGGSFLANFVGDTTSVNFDDELRLLNRVKPELPKAGRIIAWKTKEDEKSPEVEHTEGVLMDRYRDISDFHWESAGELFADNQILEWSVLPDNLLSDLRKESIK